MEIRALRAFVEVVRQGGFSRAAEAVFATQSTVSKAVKQLEEELGFQLLERAGHRSRLTEAGEVVFRRATAILAQGDDLKSELEEMRGLRGGTLRLGLPMLGSNTLFAHWFAAYRSRYPDVTLQLVEHGSKRLEELVLAGDVDLAASLLPVGKEFEWQELRREPIDALLPVDHPLAQSDSIPFKALADLPFILYGEGFALNPIILAACRENGFTPKVATQSIQVDFIIELVAAKLGIALVPRLIAEQRPHPLTRRIPVDQPAIFWHMALVWRRGSYLSHAAQAWLALASEV
ncbi:LysR family transcriptional regulator [Geomesophilobacter sediminis]|uniref:LysR family transcriptional regulator n=1 Tax=Geomesophilobacter sediminis TaxID=2798584 RepID=A0A8J7J4P6_9BACT|nr:LysR family transcriptional regulator [Geomesophilobacter sediminis]MBJ6725908.1 LysR family transcriptional regulator [Geomesophilobacter sediminis]